MSTNDQVDIFANLSPVKWDVLLDPETPSEVFIQSLIDTIPHTNKQYRDRSGDEVLNVTKVTDTTNLPPFSVIKNIVGNYAGLEFTLDIYGSDDILFIPGTIDKSCVKQSLIIETFANTIDRILRSIIDSEIEPDALSDNIIAFRKFLTVAQSGQKIVYVHTHGSVNTHMRYWELPINDTVFTASVAMYQLSEYLLEKGEDIGLIILGACNEPDPHNGKTYELRVVDKGGRYPTRTPVIAFKNNNGIFEPAQVKFYTVDEQ